MQTRIAMQKVWENGIPFLLVSFSYDRELIENIRKLPKAIWRPAHKHWKIPFSESNLSEFIFRYGERIDTDLDILLIPLRTELIRRNYSRKTQKAYFLLNKATLRNLNKHPYAVKEVDIRGYLDTINYSQKLAAISIRTLIHAIRFYYKNIIGRDLLSTYSLPKREKRIPEALSKSEVNRILLTLGNEKHQLLLRLCYGSGLRVSEVVTLKGIDIDWDKKSIRVRQGKGKKDRFTLLPTSCSELLRATIARQGEGKWLFPGMSEGTHLHVRTAEKIFSNAKSKANISKDVSIHDLRHAFAIHLLEAGTSIKLIQRLLGHASVRTTEIYARITDPSVSKIRSPLDFG